jgi:protein-S-isoprenylcysteine O-methyltransferase Ste14
MATALTPPDGARDSAREGASGRSLGQLFSDASRDLTGLVRSEIALAKVELRDDVKAAAKGGGMFAVAAALGLLAAILLSFAIVYGIVAAGLDEGWSFLIVGAVYLLLAAVLALVGKRQLKRVGPPQRTIETTKESVAALKGSS